MKQSGIAKMSEADSAICKKKRKAEWSNMPYDLLSNIANRLELIDFTSFHRVCKDWRYATEPLVDAKFSGCDPWFLLYSEEGPRCSILNKNDNVYTIEIPELAGSTCLASYDGWLLLFRDDSLFFFCPFSRAKIHLPNCPITESDDCAAAFSSAPTSQDCIVAVINHATRYKLELHTLCRGDNSWFKHQFYHHEYNLFLFKRCAFFIEGEFIYASNKRVVIFDVANTKQWSEFSLLDIKYQRNDESVLKCRLRDILSKKAKKGMHRSKDLKGKLGLGDNVAIDTCGTIYDAQNLVWGDYIWSVALFDDRVLKGVWILPRYHKH